MNIINEIKITSKTFINIVLRIALIIIYWDSSVEKHTKILIIKMKPQRIVDKLDFVAKRIPGLKFTPPTPLNGDDKCYGCFMSCDMYYIEIKVDQSHQTVKDVIISHGNSSEGISCPVLRKVLAEQEFDIFAKHLTGLHSIYQINTNDKKVKQRAYPALTALETDLTILYEHQR